MDAIKIGSEAQVGPVVHHESHPAAEFSLKFTCLAQYRARTVYLVTILHQSSAGACQLGGKGQHFARVAGKAGGVHDGIEPRQLHAIFSLAAGRVRSRKRAMKLVSTLPC